MMIQRSLTVAILLVAGALPVAAERALVAVATNFAEPATAIVERFEATSTHEIALSAGSTGKLFAQITNGAPYDVFLSADQARPALLVREGLASGQRTYAVGQLALWAADPNMPLDLDALAATPPNRFAIANPAIAPYGLAAEQSIAGLGLAEALEGRIVMGENVGQAFAMIASGNAQMGLVALSSVKSARNRFNPEYVLIPNDLHDSIRQDAVLLAHGQDNPAAKAFLAYLAGPEVADILGAFGYETAQ